MAPVPKPKKKDSLEMLDDMLNDFEGGSSDEDPLGDLELDDLLDEFGDEEKK